MATEADTCRKFVVPKLQAAGWDSDPHSIAEQRSSTDGRTVVRDMRVRDDCSKLWFNMFDYTGTATRNFADPAFDGELAFATQEEIDEAGRMIRTEVLTTEAPEDGAGELREQATENGLIDSLPAPIWKRDGVRCRKYYFDGGHVEIGAELVHELDADGKQLRAVNHTAERVRTLCA